MTANDAENWAESTAEETQRERAAGRTPASENPWYLLATVAGEQSEDRFDEELHARNRRVWNGWACQNLSNEQLPKLAADAGIKEADLEPWNADEQAFVEGVFRQKGFSIPSADQPIYLRSAFFAKPFFMQAFVFPSAVSFTNSHFSSKVVLSHSVIMQPAEFELAVFTDLILRGTTFLDSVSLTASRINRTCHFNSTQFMGQANFDQAEFHGHAQFENLEFHGPTSFDRAGFLSRCDFYASNFFMHVFFSPVSFNSEVNFHDCHFHQSCDFKPDWVGDEIIPTQFLQSSTFYNCEFLGVADFRHVAFHQYVSFTRTKFKGFAYFSKSPFEKFCLSVNGLRDA